jgi:hypothetical protein
MRPPFDDDFDQTLRMRAQDVYQRDAATGPVDLTLFTEDSVSRALCREYWELDDQGGYRYSVKTLGSRYDISPSRVSQAVAAVSEARSAAIACETCGRGFVVRSRQQLIDLQRRSSWHSRLCDGCRDARDRARVEAQRQLESDRRLFIEDAFAIRDETPIELDELSLAESLGLFALIRSPEHFATDAILPLSKRRERFAPTSDFSGAVTEP